MKSLRIFDLFIRTLRKVFLLTSLMLLVLQFYWTNALAGAGNELTSVEQQISVLKDENESLFRQLSIGNSLENVDKKARELGFTDDPDYLTVQLDQPIAVR